MDKKIIISIFARRLKEKRIEQGLTTTQLGDLVGVNNSTISRYETGKRDPDLQVSIDIAKVFGVSVEWMCGMDENMEANNLVKVYEGLSDDNKKELQQFVVFLSGKDK